LKENTSSSPLLLRLQLIFNLLSAQTNHQLSAESVKTNKILNCLKIMEQQQQQRPFNGLWPLPEDNGKMGKTITVNNVNRDSL